MRLLFPLLCAACLLAAPAPGDAEGRAPLAAAPATAPAAAPATDSASPTPVPGAVGSCADLPPPPPLPAAYDDRLTAGIPFARGNFWRADKGDTHLTVVGTYHLPDPRFAPILAALAPRIAGAQVLFVEAGPEEEAKLIDEMSRDPSLMVIMKGPTLPDLLPPEDWKILQAQLARRNIPGLIAAKMQPWYVDMMLGIPPCVLHLSKPARAGLDKQLMSLAEKDGVPIRALEPYDAGIRAIAGLSEERQIAMLRLDLAGGGTNPGAPRQLADLYFKGEHQLIWEIGRAETLRLAGDDRAAAEANYDALTKTLLTDRTRAWMKVLLPESHDKTALVAVGAAHLGGRDGLLELLKTAGFKVTPLTP